MNYAEADVLVDRVADLVRKDFISTRYGKIDKSATDQYLLGYLMGLVATQATTNPNLAQELETRCGLLSARIAKALTFVTME